MVESSELLIIGAGPAGLTAAIYGARAGLKTIIVSQMLGGSISEATLIENYPGFSQISGFELMEKIRNQAENSGVILKIPETVIKVDLSGDEKKIITDRETYLAKTVIIATGCKRKKLNVPGEEKFQGRGVSYCATCDGPLFKGKQVMVVGGGSSAVGEALYLKGLASKVYLVHRRDELRTDAILKKRILESNIEIIWDSEVKAIEGDKYTRKVRLVNKKTNKESTVDLDGVFIYVGEEPESQLAKDAGVVVDDKNFIVVNRKQETNIKSVYAAGDVTGNIHQIGVAVGEGIIAATSAYEYIRRNRGKPY